MTKQEKLDRTNAFVEIILHELEKLETQLKDPKTAFEGKEEEYADICKRGQIHPYMVGWATASVRAIKMRVECIKDTIKQ